MLIWPERSAQDLAGRFEVEHRTIDVLDGKMELGGEFAGGGWPGAFHPPEHHGVTRLVVACREQLFKPFLMFGRCPPADGLGRNW